MSKEVVAEEKKKLPAILYAICDDDTGEIIWNARGYAYKSLDKALTKLFELRVANPVKRYSLVRWFCEPNVVWDKLGITSREVK